MEGECNWTGVNDNTPKNDSPPDPFVAVRHLAFLHLEATSDHSSDEDTKFDTEEDDPSFFTGDTLFILEEVDPDTENSQFVLCPMIPYRVEASQNIKDSRQDKNGDQEPQDLPSCRINCHTSNVNHHYCMWHGSKYCCRASEPKWDVKGTIEKELYDDCLNYLECSDVMTDYTNGIWLSALLGDESVLLLETDQDDETKVSQDCRNECDVLSSGLTCLNEGSSNTLAMDDLASLCVSHSKAPEVEKGDLLKALETEMVITVEHQQDNTSSPKRKERCKLPCASAAIQDDQAGIEVENSSKEVQTASTKHSNPFMELYLVKAFTKAMTSLITMTDESVPHSLICDGPGEKEQGVEKLILEEDVIDKESPANHTEQEAHQLSEEEIQDQFTLEITKLHDGGQSQIQDQQFMGAVECSKIALKQGNIKCPCTTEGTEGEYIKEDDHTKLIRFLKANIQTPNELNLIENTEEEKDKDIHELGDSQKSPAEPENQDGNDSFEKDGEYIQKNDNIKNEKSPASGLPVSIKISDTNEIKEHESEIPDNGLEMVNSESQTDDSEPKTLECVSHIVDSNFQKVNSHVDLCRVTFDDTNFIESTTDKQEVCKQGHEHEASNINNQEDDNKSDSKSMDNCALKANDLVDQPPREKNISDSKTIDNCRVKINDLTYQPPGEKNNSNSQTIDKCIVKMNFLTDQTPREKNNLHSQTIDNGRLKMNDLTNQTPGKKNNSNSQTIDKCIVKMNDLTDQPPGEKNNLNSQTIDKCRVKMNDLTDQPPGEKNNLNSQTIDKCRVKMNDLIDQTPGEKINSHSQTIDNCRVKMNDLTDQPPGEKNNLNSQTIDKCRVKMNDLTDQPPGEKNNLNSQTIDKCRVKINDLTDQPPGEKNNSHSQIIDNCRIKMNILSDQPPGEKNTMDILKISDVSNDTTKSLEPAEGSCFLAVDKSPSSDDNLRTNSVQSVGGKQMKRNASVHKEAEMHSKKKALDIFPLNIFCASISKGHHDIINNVVVKNYQGGIAERRSSCGENGEMLSLVKSKDGMCYNSTEIEKAHSLHVKDNIPNSQEPSQVCRDPDTIRGAELVRARSIDLDQARGASCPLYFMGSASLCEKNSDSKMVKKKFKSAGKETTKTAGNEAQAVDVNEGFQPEEEKRLKRQSSIDTTGSKDINKAPKILHGIQAEIFPDCSGNLKLFCHFGDINADSTITWTKDSKLLARMQRGPKDDSPVSLAIVQTSKKDQGIYICTLKNMHGKVSTDFHLTSEVLEQLTRYQDIDGGEEIEFNQLFFREDFITDMYFGGNLHGRLATEDLHFGEGVHRKAFRSKVMCGLLPVFNPGHPCVLKVHNAIAYGTKTNNELVQKNYKLAVQECYVQNTAREYAKIYAAEAEQLEDFGTVPEIIPIFLIHRPANNIPYATVEEELVGDFVKYSVKDGKEINVLRKDSEAGQKCCTFQHWVYERTNGNLLVTDLQGVGMKLTDVGIATISKGYKGFKGNCSVTFIDQFKALHQCNKFCEILGLKSLKPINPKPKKPTATKEKPQPILTASRKSRNSTNPKNKT